MYKFSPVFLLILLLPACSLSGQNDETLFGGEGLHLTGIWGSFDWGFTAFDEAFTRTKASFIDFEFNKAVSVGLGSVKTKEAIGPDGNHKLNYGSVLIAFTPGPHRAVHPRFGFLLGNGKLKSEQDNDEVFVFQPSVGVEVNVFKWFRLGFEGGYRFVSGSETPAFSDKDFSSFFLDLNLRFGWSWGN